MNTLEANFRIVTPLFMGGANPDHHAELREPSIKGALRFWYRAIDPNYAAYEEAIFGGSGKGTGQSCFLLQVTQTTMGRISSEKWDDGKLQGVKYFSFPFKLKQNRRYIDSNPTPTNTVSSFTIRLLFKEEPDEGHRKAILASLWLLGHLGGLGSRSRRGFGTVALQAIEADEGTWRESTKLFAAHTAQNAEEWIQQFRQGLTLLKSWFPGTTNDDHSVLGNNTKFKLITAEVVTDWKESLNFIGKKMMDFRNRYDLKVTTSDYHRVRSHLCSIDSKAAAQAPSVNRAKLTVAPDRAAFGLPLTFRSTSLQYDKLDRDGKMKPFPPNVTFNGSEKSHGRSASRIHIRIIKIGQNYHPMVFRLDGPLLGSGEQIQDNKRNQSKPPSDSILDTYWTKLPAGMEVQW